MENEVRIISIVTAAKRGKIIELTMLFNANKDSVLKAGLKLADNHIGAKIQTKHVRL